MRILIIGDEPEPLQDVTKGLMIKGYAVDQAENGKIGYQMAVDEEYDHLSALRKKLKHVLGYDPIQTKIGKGYLLC